MTTALAALTERRFSTDELGSVLRSRHDEDKLRAWADGRGGVLKIDAIDNLKALSPWIYELPAKNCFLVHVRLEGDNGMSELRVVTSCASAIPALLATGGAVSAEIYLLRPMVDRNEGHGLELVTEVHRSESGTCVFRLATGEQFLSVEDQELVAMMCLCTNAEGEATSDEA